MLIKALIIKFFLIILFSHLQTPLLYGSHVSKDELTLAAFSNEPYIYKDNSGAPKGLLVDFLKKASKISKVKVRYQISSWPRAQLSAQNGTVDLIFPVVWTRERESWLEYPFKPITSFSMVMYGNKKDPFRFNGNLENIKGKRVGKIAKGKMHPNFTKAEKKQWFKVESRRTIDLLFKSIELGRLDYLVIPQSMGRKALATLDFKNVIEYEVPVGVSNIFIARSKASKKDRELWIRLTRAIEELGEIPPLK